MKPTYNFLELAMAGAVMTALGFFLSASLHQDGTQRSWFYDYQAFVAGLLAIVAALLTVRQMRRTDRRTDLRHREQLVVSTLPDRLAIIRMRELLLPRLHGSVELIRNYISGLPSQSPDDLTHGHMANGARVLHYVLGSTAELLAYAGKSPGARFFGPIQERLLDECIGWIDACLSAHRQDGWSGGETFEPVAVVLLLDAATGLEDLAQSIDYWSADVAV
jgi:hypothetical protein